LVGFEFFETAGGHNGTQKGLGPRKRRKGEGEGRGGLGRHSRGKRID
jgi:hypothetical protein